LLFDLDKTIEAFLKGSLPVEIASKVAVTFAPPDDRFPPQGLSLPAIDLFLFLIEENRELRNREPLLERQADGSVLKRSAPVRVDCHYLVTAFAEGAQRPEEDEHRILGHVMKVLVRHREVPQKFLQGTLQGQTPPVRAAAMLPSPDHGAQLWHALKSRPRASLHYVLTISVDTGDAPERLPPVTTVQLGEPS